MSPLTIGLLAYLAFKGANSKTGSVFGGNAGAVPDNRTQGGGGLAGVLGGLLGTGANGSILTNGLGDLMRRLQSSVRAKSGNRGSLLNRTNRLRRSRRTFRPFANGDGRLSGCPGVA